MPVYRNPQPFRFTPETPVERHFHDYDETWIMMGGACRAFMIDSEGRRDEFDLRAGDIWMIEAGVEHGCDPLEEGALIFPFPGTIPEGSHPPGHYYMEKEGYRPSLRVIRTPLTGREGAGDD